MNRNRPLQVETEAVVLVLDLAVLAMVVSANISNKEVLTLILITSTTFSIVSSTEAIVVEVLHQKKEIQVGQI